MGSGHRCFCFYTNKHNQTTVSTCSFITKIKALLLFTKNNEYLLSSMFPEETYRNMQCACMEGRQRFGEEKYFYFQYSKLYSVTKEKILFYQNILMVSF